MESLNKLMKSVLRANAKGVDVSATIEAARELATTPEEIALINKTELDILKSGDWLADWYNESAGGSVLNSFKAGSVKVVKI